MARQGFASLDVNDFPPASFTPIANTVTDTILWSPTIWTPIPANDARAGKVYKISAGGIISTTGTPTMLWTPRIGAGVVGDASLGATTATATGSALASAPWYLEFTLGFRTIGVAAAGASVTGNGFVAVGGPAATASIVLAMGGLTSVTTVDQTIARALHVSFQWGTSSASNTITCQWAFIRSYN